LIHDLIICIIFKTV